MCLREVFICTKNGQKYFCISALKRSQYQVSSFLTHVICLFLSCAQLSSANTPSLQYQHSGQKPKNIFVCILVQTKTSLRQEPRGLWLRPFRILLTFTFARKQFWIQSSCLRSPCLQPLFVTSKAQSKGINNTGKFLYVQGSMT